MKNLIVKPNKQKNPHNMPYKLCIVAPQVVTMGIYSGAANDVQNWDGGRGGDEKFDDHLDHLAELLKEIRGGGQRNE